MAVFINNTGLIGLAHTYECVETGFGTYGELFILTNWLEEKLALTGVCSNIGAKMKFQYLDKGVFAIIDKTSGMGFFPPFDMVRVQFPIKEFAKLKNELLTQANIDSASLECIGLIDLITKNIKNDVLYIDIM